MNPVREATRGRLPAADSGGGERRSAIRRRVSTSAAPRTRARPRENASAASAFPSLCKPRAILQLRDRLLQGVGQSVVDFVGEQPPLVVVAHEDLPEHFLALEQRLASRLAFRMADGLQFRDADAQLLHFVEKFVRRTGLTGHGTYPRRTDSAFRPEPGLSAWGTSVDRCSIVVAATAAEWCNVICQFAIKITTTPRIQGGIFLSGGTTNNWWHLRQNWAPSGLRVCQNRCEQYGQQQRMSA